MSKTETCKDQNQQRSRGNAGDRSDVRFLTFIFCVKEKLFEFLVFSEIRKDKITAAVDRLVCCHHYPSIFLQTGHISE